jgi:hypothetical protein
VKTITVLARIKEERESGREGERVRGKVGEWESGRITNYPLSYLAFKLKIDRQGFSGPGHKSLSKQ